MEIKIKEQREIKRLDSLKRLLGEGQIFVDEKNLPGRAGYLVKHDYDIDAYFRRLSRTHDKYPEREFFRVEADTLTALIQEAEEKKSSSREVDVFITAGAIGEDCLSNYTNHLSDYDVVYFRGKGRVSLSLEDWKISAKILDGGYSIS